MRRLLPYVTLLLVYLMTPSAGEIAENVAHLVTQGHTAHAIDDDAHEPDDPEHGCSGPFHVCSCHSTTAFTASFAALDVGSPVSRETRGGWHDQDAPSEGSMGSVFRPPIA